jgi:hypothetical protein
MPSSSANRRAVASSRAAHAVGLVALLSSSSTSSIVAVAKLADRGRLQTARKQRNTSSDSERRKASSIVTTNNKDNKLSNPIVVEPTEHRVHSNGDTRQLDSVKENGNKGSIRGAKEGDISSTSQRQQQQIQSNVTMLSKSPDHPFHERQLSSQLTGCCTTYAAYSATDMCSLYGEDCESGDTPSHDSGDESCEQVGLSFIGISFSVNTVLGNPYSYQLCDQFPMENIIDRSYEYVMSMDEDGWLVGGGYKSFDYSGKMP